MAKMAKAAASDSTGHPVVGKVVILYGTVKAISADGTVRVLGPNSLVFADDQIITESDGSVSLILDGTPPIHLDLGRMSQIVLDEDVYGGAGTSADAAADADRIQALLAGDQPISPEAPAAGGAADSGGGHPIVNYTLTGEEVTPESGAETRGIGFAPLETVDDGDTVPIGGDDLGAVDDEGLTEPFKGNPGGDGSDDPTKDAFIAGNLSYDFGADGPASDTPFVWSMAGLEEMGVFSQGNLLQYEVVDGGLTLNAYYIMNGYPVHDGSGDGDYKIDQMPSEPIRVDVFSLELTNVDTGAYKFTLFEPLDHATPGTEDDINYIFGYGLEDGDGSTGSGVLRMLVDDDTPVMGERNENRTVDEDDINNCQSDGNYPNDGPWHDGSFTGSPWYGHDHGPANIWGSLTGLVAFGADGPADDPRSCGIDAFSFAEENLDSLYDQKLTSKGGELSYMIVGDTLYGYVPNIIEDTNGDGDLQASFAFIKESPVDGRIVFTLELHDSGHYQFSLFDQLDHEKPVLDEMEDKMAVSDIPDGVESGRDTTIPIDFSGIIVATDFDGDPVILDEDKFVINITDDAPKEAGCLPVIGIVEEEALQPEGNQEFTDNFFDPWLIRIPDTTVATGTLAHQVSVGADEPVQFSMSEDTGGLPELTSNGEAITYEVINGVLFAYVPEESDVIGDAVQARSNTETSIPVEGRLVFTLALDSEGNYRFTLLDQLDHDDRGEDTLCIDFSSMIVATDYDGDSITLSQDFYIKVIDDVPEVSVGGPDSVKEDAAPISGTWDASIGADQPGSIQVLANGQSYNLGQAVSIMVGSQNVGTLTVNVNETWTFDPNPNLDNDYRTDFSFKIKATDADSDTESDGQTICVKDGTNPSCGGEITLSLDEEALGVAAAMGTNPTSGAEQVSATLSFTAGSDDLESFSFGNTGDLERYTNNIAGQDLYWHKDSDTQITGHFGTNSSGPVAITLTLSAPASIAYGTTGTVTVMAALSDNLNHILGKGEQNLDLGDVRVYASDHDGDSTFGKVNLFAKDDVPMAVNDCISTEAGEATGKTYNLMLILDTSGSISDSDLGKEVQAMKDLLDKYAEDIAEGGEAGVQVRIVSFSSSATLYGSALESIADAQDHLDVILAAGTNGSTNYEDALAKATTGMAGWTPTAVDHANVVYFVSDGEPNVGTVNEGAWETTLGNVGATAWAIGVGAGPSDTDLQDVAYPDGNVDNFDDLLDGLIGTIGPQTASGNVMTNDLQGADGAEVTAVSYIDEDGKAATANVDDDGVTVKTLLGELTIESDGDYSYKGNTEGLFDQKVTVNTDNTNLGTGMSDDGMVKVTAVGAGPTTLIDNGDAFGVASDDGGDDGRYDEINYLGGGKSEAMIFELQDGKVAESALVNITEFYGTETGVGTEVGSYELYRDGVKVQSVTTFNAASDNGDFVLSIDGPECGFDEIRFFANEGTSVTGPDNSDYSIKSITFDLYQQDVFHYEITDGDGDKSCADLTINIDIDTLIDDQTPN